MPRVLIADKMSASAVRVFRERGLDVDVMTGLSRPELLRVIPDYDALAVRSATGADADIISAAGKLKVIGRAGIGTDNIDKKTATERGIVVMNTPYGNAITTAEHAISLLLACARQIPAASQRTQAGEWPKSDFRGVELFGKTLGVIGCGNIGALVAERALGFKMKVIAYDPYLTSGRALELGVEKGELPEIFKRSDAITLHTPLTDSTRGIISRNALAQTKSGLILVNAARGGLVDEEAVRDALESGHLRAAGFDVFAVEPARDNILFGAPNFIATPHLGAATLEAQENVAIQIARQISDYLLTGAVTNALNMPAISAGDAPRIRPYIDLGEKLGVLMGQLLRSSVKTVELTYRGGITGLNTNPVSAAVLAGLLRSVMPQVNMVSAPTIARDAGIEVKDSYIDESERGESLIRVSVGTAERKFAVIGTLFRGEPRSVRLFGVPMNAGFSEHMLYVRNENRPGFIGALGNILAESNINIATLSLGRMDNGENEAVCLVSVDEPVPGSVIETIRAIDQVKIVNTVHI